PLEAAERSNAASLCAALAGHPLRVLQAAAIVREQGIPLESWARGIGPQALVTEMMASTDEKQRRLLVALTALPGVPLQAQHISGRAEVGDVEPSLMALTRRGLIVSSRSRHRLADLVGDWLRRTEDTSPSVHRAITYFTSWAERYRRSADTLLETADAL